MGFIPRHPVQLQRDPLMYLLGYAGRTLSQRLGRRLIVNQKMRGFEGRPVFACGCRAGAEYDNTADYEQ